MVDGADRADQADGPRGDLEFGTLPGLVAVAAARYGERIAIEDGSISISYQGLLDAARRAARGLLALGIAHGDRVAIWAPNRWEWIVAALGIHLAGGVLVPLNTRYKGGEAAWILGKSGARAIFVVGRFLGNDYLAMLEREDLPALTARIVWDEADGAAIPAGAMGWNAFLGGGERVTGELQRVRENAVRPTDLSDLLFTSGTTGKPKGVMCTHAQTLRAFRSWADLAGLRAGDRYLVVPPFFHSFGYKAGWVASLMMGATILPQPVFDGDAVLARIARDRVSVLPGPPTLYQSMLSALDAGRAPDLSSLRLAVTGAAVIPVQLIQRMRESIGFETVLTAYGLTEGTGVSTMCRRDDDAETIARTSGRAIPGVRVRIVGVEGEELPPGVPGEIQVSGYTVTKGYEGSPEDTAAAMDGEWLRTGDIGTLDARGNLAITDRLKDMFIVGGFNAYPAEIEQVLTTHESIAQVAVVGLPDERLGEVGMAFVVPRPGRTVDEAELVAWSRERMANYKVPRRVAVVDKLPTNASGKVLKHELRARASAG
ncbi:MAG TPA: FadD3 family acyl-CoA ligase [Polyangiaceae bacterium]